MVVVSFERLPACLLARVGSSTVNGRMAQEGLNVKGKGRARNRNVL